MRLRKKLAVILAALILGSAVMSGCEKGSLPDNNSQTEVSSDESVSSAASENTSTGETPAFKEVDETEKINYGINAFSSELFKTEYAKSNSADNVFLSPYSVYTALSMLNNAAKGSTLNEMNNMLGGNFPNKAVNGNPVSVDGLNTFFKNYINLPIGDASTFKTANSIWIMQRDNVKIRDSFINTTKECYNAEIFNEPYGDSTVDKINGWVDENTDHMIKKMLSPKSITPDTVSVLLNAVAFDGKWTAPYEESDVEKNTFHNADNSESQVDFMYSDEHNYIDDNGKATGFVKTYKGDEDHSFCFIALLPNESIGIDKYIEEELTDEKFKECFYKSTSGEVHAALPKFKFDTSYNLNSLADMGIPTAFSPSADFSGFAESENGNIYISEVIHKAHVEVDEKGTKAAASTAIIMEDNAMEAEPEYYTVTLDRPFVFAIYDYDNEMPLFIGAVRALENSPE